MPCGKLSAIAGNNGSRFLRGNDIQNCPSQFVNTVLKVFENVALVFVFDDWAAKHYQKSRFHRTSIEHEHIGMHRLKRSVQRLPQQGADYRDATRESAIVLVQFCLFQIFTNQILLGGLVTA